MRITTIEIKNFRAFKGSPLKIDLHKSGKNQVIGLAILHASQR